MRLLLSLLFPVLTLQAQFPQFRNYNVRDGLPSSEVYAMMQDASGYLWFTTDMGVSRFDGYGFRNFSTQDGMADNTIFGVQQDRKGRTWFRSFSGKLSYFWQGRMHSLPCNETLARELQTTTMTSLFVDEGDTLWIGTGKKFALKIAPGWKDTQLTRISFGTENGYFCVFGKNEFIYGGGNINAKTLDVYQGVRKKQCSVVVHDGNAMAAVRFSVTLLNGGEFLVTANTSITCITPEGAVLSRARLSSIGICTLEDADGSLFACCYDGVITWTGKRLEGERRVPELDQKVVTAICRDRENTLWYCTEGNGVFCIPQRNFLYYTPANGLSESKISCAATCGTRVLIGHLDGTFSVLDDTSVRSISPRRVTDFNGQPNRISSILCFDAQHLFVASVACIYELDLSQSATTKLHPSGSKKLIVSADGGIWSVRFRLLMKQDPHTFQVLKTIPVGVYVDNVYEDRSGRLWIGAINGLWTYSETEGLIYLGNTNPLLASRIVGLQETPDGTLWMVSRGNGVIVKKGDRFFNITEKEGLAGNMCRAICIDGNVVWAGTNNGLSRITLTNTDSLRYTISTFTSRNGLLTNEVNDLLRVKNKLWVVHNNGISVFDPAVLQNNKQPPPVYITATLVNGDTVNAGARPFEYDQNYFNLRFIGLSYKDPGTIEYKYKMEGIDSGWVYTTYTSVQYQTLPPGDYRFVVYARNNDGFWSTSPAMFAFTVLPPWWSTWWFKSLATVVLLLFVAVLFKLRLSAIRRRDQKKAALQNRIAATELTALRAQMNPHFVFNAINSVQYFITNNDPDSSQKYLSKFARLIRYVLDNSKLASIPVQKEIDALTLYLDLEALRFGNRFAYSIQVHPNVDKEYTQIPSMLIQPYIENAIWHGIMHSKRDGRLTIALEMDHSILKCTIEDNGIGRKQSQALRQEQDSQHRSVGMSNTQERLEIINQVNNSRLSVLVTDLYTSAGEAEGTRVTINIPCN